MTTRTPAQAGRRWRGRDVSFLALLIAVACAVNADALLDIWRFARHDVDHGHLVLVPFVAAAMVWIRRQRFVFLRYRPSLLGPAVILGGILLRWWGLETDTLAAWHLAALVCLVGCVLSMTGAELFRQFGAALIALLFLVPVPGAVRQSLAVPLQSMAASVTTSLLDLRGVPAIQQGSVIVINGEQVAVGEACNGMRMVLALALVVFAFVASMPFRVQTRILLVAVSPVIALFCNVLRLVPTSLVYGYGSPDTAARFHDVAGWLMLPAALIMLLGVVRLLRWLDLPVMSWRLSTT